MILTGDSQAAALELNQALPPDRRGPSPGAFYKSDRAKPRPAGGAGGASHTSRRASLTDILPWSSPGVIGDKSWLIG